MALVDRPGRARGPDPGDGARVALARGRRTRHRSARAAARSSRPRRRPAGAPAPALPAGPAGARSRGHRRHDRRGCPTRASSRRARTCCRRWPIAGLRSPAPSACRGSWPGSARPTAAPGTASRTTASLRPFLLEETYEVYDALEGGATPDARRGAGRPAAPDRAPRPVRGRGRRLRPVGRASGRS